MLPRFSPEAMEANKALVDLLQRIAGDKGATPAQIALAWVLAQSTDIVAIPGTKRRTYLEENVRASDLVLTPSESARIEEVLPKGTAAGARYPDMSSVNR